MQQMQAAQLQQEQLQAAAAAGVLAGLRLDGLSGGQYRPKAAGPAARRVPSGGLGDRSAASSDGEADNGRSRSAERRKTERAAKAEAKAAAAAKAAADVLGACRGSDLVGNLGCGPC